MTKTEMLNKVNRIVRALEALPDGANPIAVYGCDGHDYIQLSSTEETPPASETVDVESDGGLYKEHRADVLGVSVIWLEI